MESMARLLAEAQLAVERAETEAKTLIPLKVQITAFAQKRHRLREMQTEFLEGLLYVAAGLGVTTLSQGVNLRAIDLEGTESPLYVHSKHVSVAEFCDLASVAEYVQTCHRVMDAMCGILRTETEKGVALSEVQSRMKGIVTNFRHA